MMKRIQNSCAFSVLLLILFVPVHGNIVEHRAHGIPESKDFQVWVNGTELFTAQAGNRYHGYYSFCAFDFDEPVTVRVQFTQAIKWIDILPSIIDVSHRSLDDYTFEFQLSEPEKLTFLVNNDKRNVLHILTNLPESEKPDPGDKNVLFYRGGQTYDIGILDLEDNQTLYLESGARLKGMIRIRDASKVRILGRGMLDGSDNTSENGRPDNDEQWRIIYMDHSEDISIEGITIYNSLRWTIHPYACTNLRINNINIINWDFGSDGMDISACQDVKITDCFLRTNDDPIVIKALSFAENMYHPHPRNKNPDVKNVLVEGCTLWNMEYGNAIEIGFELRCNEISGLIFRDCDVIMQDGRGAVFSIHNSDNALVKDVLFENIRVENCNLVASHKLFDIAILFSMWSYDKFSDPEMIKKYRYNDAWDNLLPVLPGTEGFHASHRGQVKNITFRNIQVLDGSLPYSVINGFDKEHLVEDVIFENISVSGNKITSEKELKLYQKFSNNVVIK